MKYDLTLSEHNAPSTLAGGVINTAIFTRQVPGPQARPTPSCAFKEWRLRLRWFEKKEPTQLGRPYYYFRVVYLQNLLSGELPFNIHAPNLNARDASRRHQLGSVRGDCGFDVSLVHLVCNEDAQGRSAPFEKCTRPVWCFVHHPSNLSSIRTLPRAVNRRLQSPWRNCSRSMIRRSILSSLYSTQTV